MAGSLPLILTAVSTGLGVISSLSQGAAESSAAHYNAAVAKRNAQIAIQQGNVDAENQRRKAVLTIGSARALYGASGVTSEGSPIDVLASSAASAELDNQTIKYRARLRALGYQDQANLDNYSAGVASSNGYSGAIGALLGGASDLYTNYGLLASGSTGAGPGADPYPGVTGR